MNRFLCPGMAARGGGWPGNAEALHVSFSTQPLISSLIIPRKSTSTDEKSVAEMEISCLSSTRTFILFEPSVLIKLLGSIFSIVGIQRLGTI